jgi:hypothetical protein
VFVDEYKEGFKVKGEEKAMVVKVTNIITISIVIELYCWLQHNSMIIAKNRNNVFFGGINMVEQLYIK